ncbi:MAG: hypothetical protein ACKO6F_09475 [Cyanobium sp.]
MAHPASHRPAAPHRSAAPAFPVSPGKLRTVAGLWALALGLSAALVAAGRHWPAPLPIRTDAVLALLVLPPLAVALGLLGRWRLPAAAHGAESAPSSDPSQA